MELWDLETIEAAFSDAAVNPALWARALNVVTAQTGSFGANSGSYCGKPTAKPTNQ